MCNLVDLWRRIHVRNDHGQDAEIRYVNAVVEDLVKNRKKYSFKKLI